MSWNNAYKENMLRAAEASASSLQRMERELRPQIAALTAENTRLHNTMRRLMQERDGLVKDVIRIADTMDTGTSALLDVQDALRAAVAACADGDKGEG